MRKEANTLFDNLNTVQNDAVQCTDGPILILAGAGSGKTRVLTRKIAYLIAKNKARPEEILAVTFTNKAAEEMKNRIALWTGDTRNLWTGTFHSICARILRIEADKIGYTSSFVIYDADDQQRLIKSILKDLNIPAQYVTPAGLSNIISNLKNNLVTPAEFLDTALSPWEKTAAQVYPEYQNRLRKYHAFDFDDLLLIPLEMFEHSPDTLDKYRNKFKYILVDEYQDTNKAQYQFLYLLSERHKNICVVGDDDQSIYRWRGADIRNILEFEKHFQNASVFRLEQNYRSTQNILNAANSVIVKNKGRKAKTLWSDLGQGAPVTIFEAENERLEAAKIVETIQNEVFRHKRPFKDFVILYRTNAQSRALEEGLRRRGINYTIVGGIRFYERKEIKDILAYLKLVANPRDTISLKRIINVPLRGIGAATIEKLELFALEKDISLFDVLKQADQIDTLAARMKKKLLDFHSLLQKYVSLKDQISPGELAHTMVDEIGFLSMYKEDQSAEAQSRIDNIKEFLSAIHEYNSYTEEPSLAGFLEEVSLISDIDRWDDKSNAITLMTLHSAKGLEYPVVFIAGMEDGLFPGYRSFDDTEALEEERRLCYVGMTRAKEKLYLIYTQQRRLYNEMKSRLPSRFLYEIDADVTDWSKQRQPVVSKKTHYYEKTFNNSDSFSQKTPDYESFSQESQELFPGKRIRHAQYGCGEIVKIEGSGRNQKLSIRFESGNVKKFAAQYVKFEEG